MNKLRIEKDGTYDLSVNSEIQIFDSSATINLNKNLEKIIIFDIANSNVNFKIHTDVEIILLHNKTTSTSKIKFDVVERNIRVNINSIALTENNDKFERDVWISHSAKDSYTNYKFFGFAFGSSSLVVNAISKIHKGMHGSEAHQILRVLTEENAKAIAQPGLLVDDFDVIASHGNSIGQLDQRSMFYLQSRGIPKPIARWLIVKGKMKEVLSNMDKDISESILKDVATTLGVRYE